MLGSQSGALDEIVEMTRIVTECRKQGRVVSARKIGRGDFQRFRAVSEFFENVLGRLDQLGALFDQLVAAAGDWRMNRARNGEDLAPLFGSQPGGDQRAALGGGFDD